MTLIFIFQIVLFGIVVYWLQGGFPSQIKKDISRGFLSSVFVFISCSVFVFFIESLNSSLINNENSLLSLNALVLFIPIFIYCWFLRKVFHMNRSRDLTFVLQIVITYFLPIAFLVLLLKSDFQFIELSGILLIGFTFHCVFTLSQLILQKNFATVKLFSNLILSTLFASIALVVCYYCIVQQIINFKCNSKDHPIIIAIVLFGFWLGNLLLFFSVRQEETILPQLTNNKNQALLAAYHLIVVFITICLYTMQHSYFWA
jgi:hypothetical protein